MGGLMGKIVVSLDARSRRSRSPKEVGLASVGAGIHAQLPLALGHSKV